MTLKKLLRRTLFDVSTSVPIRSPSVRVSAFTPSGPSIDNWAAFSENAKELVSLLGEDVGELFEPESLSQEDHERMQAFKGWTERWENSRVEVGIGTEWMGSPSVVPLIHLACHACTVIRPNPQNVPLLPSGSSSFQLLEQIRSSVIRSVKMMALYRARISQTGEDVLVIVVRACDRTAIADWAINANFEMAEVERDIVDTSVFPAIASSSTQSPPPPLQMHKGFLNTIKASIPKLADVLERAMRAFPGDRQPRVLFAGHSAGGAMAGLLFAHFVTCSGRYRFLDPPPGESGEKVSLNCITFGALPTLSQNITAGVKALLTARSRSTSSPNSASAFLAIVTEGDPCIRLDKLYAGFLVAHLRSMYQEQEGQQQREQQQPPSRDPLRMSLHTVGDLVMFRSVNLFGGRREIKAYGIEEGMLDGIAFTDFTVHFMWKHAELLREFFVARPGN